MNITNKSETILNWVPENINYVPDRPGVYVFRNFPTETGGIVYIGSSNDLKQRIMEHYISRDIPEVNFFDWYETDSIESARAFEKLWIDKYSPKYNERAG